LITFLSVVGHAQVTSSAMSGAIKSTTGEMLPGASVEVLRLLEQSIILQQMLTENMLFKD
jgi:hypothetical protein